MQAFLRRRAGMTLVELLVVVGILMSLAVVVLPNLSTTLESRRGREAARMLTSFIAKAQSRAVGRREWSGFMLAPVNGSSYAVADLFLADVPPVYRGDTVPAVVTIQGVAPTSRQAVWTNSALASFTTVGGTNGDLIRFGGRDPWYEVNGTPLPGLSGTLTFGLRGDLSGAEEDSGYQAHNTPWPAVTSAGISFEILRQPVPAGSPFTFPDARVIDLYWSGYGPPQVGTVANTYMFFEVGTTGTATAGATTSLLYDGTGRLRQIQVKLGSAAPRRLAVTGPVFLLVGRADRVGQAYSSSAGGSDDSLGANWQYGDSHWIAIDPFTGLVRSAECKPQATTPIESQEWIRQALVTGGG